MSANSKTSSGIFEALSEFIEKGRLQVAKALLDRGARMDMARTDGLTEAGLALKSDHQDLALWVIAQGCRPRIADLEHDPDGLFKLSPVEAAALGGHCDLLIKMIDKGKIDTTDEQVMNSLREQAQLGEKTEAVAFVDAIRAQTRLHSIMKMAVANVARPR